MSTFATEKLKQLVSYAIKGAGFNPLIEVTGYIGIRVLNGTLCLCTTDGTNHTRVSYTCSADDMDVTVDAEVFAKLISKINSGEVDMKVVNNTLEVTNANSRYTLALIPDETGNLLSFPDYFPLQEEEIGKISASDLNTIKTALGASLSNAVSSVYTNYYFGDIVASTDRCMMGTYRVKMFNTPYLINRAFIDLVSMTGYDATIYKSDKMLVAEIRSEMCDVDVCATIQTNVEEFNIEGINKFMSLEVNSFCRFKKSQMLDLLDRLALFVTKFDDGAINLHFTKNYIEVSSLASSGVERVEVTEFKNDKDMTIKINIERLRNQLKAYTSEIVDLHYGSDVCIKLTDGNVFQLIALMQ